MRVDNKMKIMKRWETNSQEFLPCYCCMFESYNYRKYFEHLLLGKMLMIIHLNVHLSFLFRTFASIILTFSNKIPHFTWFLLSHKSYLMTYTMYYMHKLKHAIYITKMNAISLTESIFHLVNRVIYREKKIYMRWFLT